MSTLVKLSAPVPEVLAQGLLKLSKTEETSMSSGEMPS
jgi:hypothetical protein